MESLFTEVANDVFLYQLHCIPQQILEWIHFGTGLPLHVFKSTGC